MKKVFITSLIALMVSAYSYGGIVISLKLEIGKKSSGCSGFGICSIKIDATLGDGFLKGTLDVNQDRGSMIIGISEEDLLKYQPDKIVYLKGKRTVVFEEDFTFPNEINTATKVTKVLVIKKGEYPLNYKNGYYFIEFPI